MSNKKLIFTISILFMFIFILNSVIISAQETNATINEEGAIKCMEDSQAFIDELKNANFNVARLEDKLKQATSLFEAEQVKIEKNRNYALVGEYCVEIEGLRDLAFVSRDELLALESFYQESITEGMNSSELDILMNKVRNEIRDERYEKVEELVPGVYEAIIDLKSSYTALEILKRNTRNAFIRFFTENWQFKLIIFIILIVLFIIFKPRIHRAMIQNKINKLELRKKTIKNLIKKTQKGYFEGASIAEGTYNIRTKKFAEMVRDIDRQLPLLKEELMRMQRKK